MRGRSRQTLTISAMAVATALVGLWAFRTGGWRSSPADHVSTGQKSAAFEESPAGSDLPRACREMADWILRSQGPSLRAVVRVPFVVAGDLDVAALDRCYRETLGPGLELLSAEYFTTPPDQPITVLLFRNQESYREYSERFSGRTSTSPYGFYRDHLRLVIVNAQAGPAAVGHELTHALMAFDFPAAPPWLREGLAAMHEDDFPSRSPQRGTSRRFPVLWDAVHRGELQSLESLLRADSFSDTQQSLHYAYAQQFCCYLQRQGLLGQVYRAMHDNGKHKNDPSGEATVRRILGNRSWPEIDADFREFIRRSSGGFRLSAMADPISLLAGTTNDLR